jgi:hypothetical protein
MHVPGGYLVSVIGKPEAKPAAPATSNFMAYKGNRLQFGKLLMNETDLTIVDLDPHDPLDFYLQRYKHQLVPGYSKITPAFGLRVFMKDFDKIQAAKRGSPCR